MKYLIYGCLIASLAGCASITEGERAEVAQGMTKAEVVKILGRPNATSTNGAGAEGLYWHQGLAFMGKQASEFCVILHDDHVYRWGPYRCPND